MLAVVPLTQRGVSHGVGSEEVLRLSLQVSSSVQYATRPTIGLVLLGATPVAPTQVAAPLASAVMGEVKLPSRRT